MQIRPIAVNLIFFSDKLYSQLQKKHLVKNF